MSEAETDEREIFLSFKRDTTKISRKLILSRGTLLSVLREQDPTLMISIIQDHERETC